MSFELIDQVCGMWQLQLDGRLCSSIPPPSRLGNTRNSCWHQYSSPPRQNLPALWPSFSLNLSRTCFSPLTKTLFSSTLASCIKFPLSPSFSKGATGGHLGVDTRHLEVLLSAPVPVPQQAVLAGAGAHDGWHLQLLNPLNIS